FDSVGEASDPRDTSTIGVQFTETMRGYFSTHEISSYDLAYDRGKEENSPFEFTLTIQSEDVDSLINISDHEAGLFGTMYAPALSSTPLSAFKGVFNLFIVDPAQPERKKMQYSAQLISQDGQRYFFDGLRMFTTTKE